MSARKMARPDPIDHADAVLASLTVDDWNRWVRRQYERRAALVAGADEAPWDAPENRVARLAWEAEAEGEITASVSWDTALADAVEAARKDANAAGARVLQTFLEFARERERRRAGGRPEDRSLQAKAEAVLRDAKKFRTLGDACAAHGITRKQFEYQRRKAIDARRAVMVKNLFHLFPAKSTTGG